MRLASFVGLVALVLGSTPPPAVFADGNPPFIPKAAGWLQSVNYYRAMAGLPGVSEEPSWSSGAYNHSCYMLEYGIGHNEEPSTTGRPYGYTPSGNEAGSHGNVAVSSATGRTERSFVELWMTGPFHAIGILRQGLTRVGYGQCERSVTPTGWHSGATLNILSDPGSFQKPAAPILFPGNGTVTSLDRFVAESPNPVTLCDTAVGWPRNPATGQLVAAGLPVVAMLPDPSFASHPTATMYGPSGAVGVCVLSKYNTGSNADAQSILDYDNAVTIVPHGILAPGTYTVNLQTSNRSLSWSFTVDPAASDNLAVATASPSAPPSGWTALSPARFVDSRIPQGATKLLARTAKRVKLTERLGLPATAVAVTANFTVVNTSGPGHLIVWNCSNPMPEVSTLNFVGGDIVANSATIPLDSGGSLCLYSATATDIVIDINGYYSTTGTAKFVEMTPIRVADTRINQGIPGRMRKDTMFELPLPNVPAGATGVALNVTSVDPLQPGFITVYPCGTRPITSSLNPTPGQIRPNMAITPLSSRNSVCLFVSIDVDVVVDLLGFMVNGGSTMFTPSVPFRWLDTRLRWSVEMNGGTGGAPLYQGQVMTLQIAGQRGVPEGAKAVSINLTAVDGLGGGFLTAYPCGGPRPITSNVNHGRSSAVANGAIVSLSASGQLCLFSLIPVNAIIDVNGWWS
ncbi:MAG: CAP domain-containing protein [Actinomycetota bacterium]|nr:CAP domain-containing protein [Actinomycetota bacterium]